MLSSLANRLYWLGRNLERAESTARLLNVYSNLLLDLPDDAGIGWETLLRVTGAEEQASAPRRWELSNSVVRHLAADRENANSIYSCVAVARENMRTLRELVPREGFESVNDLYLFAQAKLGRQRYVRIRFTVLREVVQRCQQIHGLLAGNMSRGVAYSFIELGRLIERADMTTRIIDVASEAQGSGEQMVSDHDAVIWINVLRCASGYQMYRQSVRSRVTPVRVLHFLINDLNFPRSVRYCLHGVRRGAEALPRGELPVGAVDLLLEKMDNTPLRLLLRDELNARLDDFQVEMGNIHNAISETWFEPYTEEELTEQ